LPLLAQESTVSGQVLDKETNTALSRVTVRLKGGKAGAITDKDGKYKLTLPSGAASQGVITFSFIGYRTVEVPIAGKSTIDAALEVDWKLLEDVVVTALGVKKETKKLGYSTAVVKGESMTQARETNIANSLVGKVAGVNVSAPAAGAAGSSRVVIRGNTSISSDNQPLYVVNGIPIDNSNLGSAGQWGGFDAGDGISSLNPDDIESMNVLKGATAAALYGSRAKNGVILITTKRGSGGGKGIGVEFNSNLVFENIRNYLDPQQQYGQGLRGNKPSSADAARTAGLNSWGAKLDGSSVMQFDGVSRPYSAQTTNLNDYYKTGMTFTNTLSLGGGNENINYRISLSDLSNSSVYQNTTLDRKIFNASTSFKLNESISGDASIIYTTEKSSNRPGQSDAPGNGNFAITFLPTSLNASSLLGPNNNGTDKYYNELTNFTDNVYTTNPYFAAYKFLNETQKDRIIASTSLKYAFTDWLSLQARVGQDYFTFQGNSITPSGTAYLASGFGNVNKTSQTTSEVNADALLTFDKNLTEDISLTASVGGNIRKGRTEQYGVAGNTLVFPNIYNPQYAISSVPSYRIFQKEIQSVYGSIELSFQEMLFLNATARNDWFSTVAKDNYSYFYPSVSASFVFSEVLKADWLTFGKLRVAYANVGGDTDPYATKLYYNINAAKINGNPIGGFDNIVPNTTLKPLAVSEIEAGLELKLFDARLTFDAAWYQKDTRNEIVTATVSGTSGFQSAIINNGQLQNTGFEFLLSGKIIDDKDFKWTSSLNFSVNNNTVIALAEGQKSLSIAQSRTLTAFVQHRVGEPFAQIVAFDFARDKAGSIIYDADGLPKQGELVSMGTGVHPYTGGWENEFRFGNFSLSALIDFKFGGKIFSATNAYMYQFGLHKETLPGRDGGITGVGVTEDGKPNTKLVTADKIQDYYGRIGGQIGTPFVYDASFIKLRQLSIGYDLPTSLLENSPIKRLTLSLVGRNLLILMKNVPNIDPETNINTTNAQGLELGGIPPTRTVGFNLNVKF
jgi:TonB-linked SusC/RagA family outer membrane protein